MDDWFSRLIFLENDKSKKDYYLCFTEKQEIEKDKYILLKNCTYVQAKRYALQRFFTKFESIYLKEEMDFTVKKLHEVVTINQDYLIYLV